MRDARPDLDSLDHVGNRLQRLDVGVHHDVLDAANVVLQHSPNTVAPAAADTYYGNARGGSLPGILLRLDGLRLLDYHRSVLCPRSIDFNHDPLLPRDMSTSLTLPTCGRGRHVGQMRDVTLVAQECEHSDDRAVNIREKYCDKM